MIERYELLRAMLMSSDNLAAESLAHAHPGGYEKFLKDTAENISEMNLKDTVIVDSTGLLAGNQSSVNDLKEFLFTLRKYHIIQLLSSEKLYTYEYRRGKKTIKVHMKNTNPQMWTYDNIILTKTGFTNAAGRCLAMLVEKNNELYAVISLGNKTLFQRSKNITELMNEIGDR
jgi:D-alanyl-D-alanine endopeptidase (penicillin-binding protein 7)